MATHAVDRGCARAAARAARGARALQASTRPREAPGRAPAWRHGDARRRCAQTFHRAIRSDRGGGRRMKLVRAIRAAVAVAVVAVAVGLLAGGSSAARTGGSGILRVGTISYIDTVNPYNYVESQATTAMGMIYPQLVQYLYGPHGYYFAPDWASSWKESKDGKTWTFHLHPGTKWSDGQPLTATDAAWTINTTLKYGKGPTAEMVGPLSHVTGAD